MKLQLRVDVYGMHFEGGASVEVPELMEVCFQPMNVNHEPVFSAINDGVSDGSYQMEMVVKAREDAAKILANQLTELILKEMSSHDTYNGY